MDLTRSIDTLVSQIDVQSLLANIDYRAARSKEELQKAYSLVYKEYLKRKYVTENQSGLRISIHNALPETTTFVGIADSEVLATATVIVDSPLGLPMDKIYSDDLKKIRKKGKKI